MERVCINKLSIVDSPGPLHFGRDQDFSNFADNVTFCVRLYDNTLVMSTKSSGDIGHFLVVDAMGSPGKECSMADYDFSFERMCMVPGVHRVTIGDCGMFSNKLDVETGRDAKLEIVRDFDTIIVRVGPSAELKLNGMFDNAILAVNELARVECHSVISDLAITSVGEGAKINITTMPDCTVYATERPLDVTIKSIEGFDDVAAEPVYTNPNRDEAGLPDIASHVMRSFARRQIGGGFTPTRRWSSMDEQIDTERRLLRAMFGVIGGLSTDHGDFVDRVANQAFVASQQNRPPPRRREMCKVGNVTLPASEIEQEYIDEDEVKQPAQKKRRTGAAAKEDEYVSNKPVLPRGEKFCIVCKSHTAKVMLNPCHHLDLCIECAYKAMEYDHSSKCPTCGDPVTDGVRVYR